MIAKHPGPCKDHPYQDARFGKGFRAFTESVVKGRHIGWRCTVCAPRKEAMKNRGGVYLTSDLIRAP